MKLTINRITHPHFKTEVDVTVGHINYGGHMSNSAFLEVCHEARIRFFESFGQSEKKFYDYYTIQNDAVIKFLGQVVMQEKLSIEIEVRNISKASFELIYDIKNLSTGKDAAIVSTTLTYFDYQKNKICRLPSEFSEKFNQI